MRDPKRIDRILFILREYWKTNPDLRLGQIVTNLTTATHKMEDADGFPGISIFSLEDNDMEKLLLESLDK